MTGTQRQITAAITNLEKAILANTGKKWTDERRLRHSIRLKNNPNMLGKRNSVNTEFKPGICSSTRPFTEGHIPWNKGVKYENISKEKHWNWQGGKTKTSAKIRNSFEYRLWRTAVFERDNYTCIWCEAKSGCGVTVELEADHIKPFHLYPELRFAIDNGRTLCHNCHTKTSTYLKRGKLPVQEEK